jgi:hypothetical protein
LSGPATTYIANGPLSYAISAYTTGSKFVLYDNGNFALLYPNLLPYVGTFREESGSLTFRFAANNGRWEATGVINGDRLEVRYNGDMELSDFENAAYTRSQ